jgi:hypothetical protein
MLRGSSYIYTGVMLLNLIPSNQQSGKFTVTPNGNGIKLNWRRFALRTGFRFAILIPAAGLAKCI